MDRRVHLAGLYIHPVKSLRGCAVASAEVDALGLVGDRRFLVVDEAGRFLTQRTLPRMALVGTALSSETLTLSAEGAGDLPVPRAADPAALLRTVGIWSSEGLQAEDCGDAAAAWLGNFLGVKCRLVRSGAAFQRPMLKPKTARPGDAVAFPDAYPFLAISEASLADLNDRLVARGEAVVVSDKFGVRITDIVSPAERVARLR
ncbi:MAG: MOSC N-terminal beta barrel domain-containing protein [Pseudomonadota bacterium]